MPKLIHMKQPTSFWISPILSFQICYRILSISFKAYTRNNAVCCKVGVWMMMMVVVVVMVMIREYYTAHSCQIVAWIWGAGTGNPLHTLLVPAEITSCPVMIRLCLDGSCHMSTAFISVISAKLFAQKPTSSWHRHWLVRYSCIPAAGVLYKATDAFCTWTIHGLLRHILLITTRTGCELNGNSRNYVGYWVAGVSLVAVVFTHIETAVTLQRSPNYYNWMPNTICHSKIVSCVLLLFRWMSWVLLWSLG